MSRLGWADALTILLVVFVVLLIGIWIGRRGRPGLPSPSKDVERDRDIGWWT